MAMSAPPSDSREIQCPCCGAYLGSIGLDGSYMRFPPCRGCGWQWVGQAVGKRARQTVDTPCGPIEVKSRG